LDSTLKIPLESKLVTDELAATWIFTSEKYDKEKKNALEELGILVFHTSGSKHVDPKEVVQILGEKLVSSLLIEGGGTINGSFLENKLIDKVILYFAPKLIGGQHAPTFLEGTGIEKMRDAVELTDISFIKVGKDYKFTGYPIYTNEGV
jgi:diaminohydroxyphosphoribosylaminopyrimidine deaminase/5-amino-6-(5-phosphoribosylamino)uracil reductase